MADSGKLCDARKDRRQQLAEARQRCPRWAMHKATGQYVEREEARESFRLEALASWEASQETGRHLTGTEVRAWLDTWGSGTELEPPDCHVS